MAHADIEAIRAELDEYFNAETRKPGDVDVSQICQQYGLSESRARDKVKALAQKHPDKWQALKVKDGDVYRLVLRRR